MASYVIMTALEIFSTCRPVCASHKCRLYYPRPHSPEYASL